MQNWSGTQMYRPMGLFISIQTCKSQRLPKQEMATYWGLQTNLWRDLQGCSKNTLQVSSIIKKNRFFDLKLCFTFVASSLAFDSDKISSCIVALNDMIIFKDFQGFYFKKWQIVPDKFWLV